MAISERCGECDKPLRGHLRRAKSMTGKTLHKAAKIKKQSKERKG